MGGTGGTDLHRVHCADRREAGVVTCGRGGLNRDAEGKSKEEGLHSDDEAEEPGAAGAEAAQARPAAASSLFGF